MNQMSGIASAPTGSFKARFTTSEFLHMVESGAFDGWKIELVDGELERMPPPNNDHGRRQMAIGIRLAGVTAEALVRGEVAIDLGNDTLVGCDAALLAAPVVGRRPLVASDIALVVEVAETTLARDMRMKAGKYAAAGIAVYWVVDADRSVVHVHTEPLDGDYALINTVRFGEPLAVPGTKASIVID